MLEVHSFFLVEATTIHGEGRSWGSYLEQFTKLLLDLPIPNLAEPYQPTFLYFIEYLIISTKQSSVYLVLHSQLYQTIFWTMPEIITKFRKRYNVKQ